MSLPLASLGPEADALAQEIDRLHGPVALVRRCADLVEVLAVVRSGLALGVLADASEDLSPAAVDAFQQAGAVVAVVVAAQDDGPWRHLGVATIEATTTVRDAAQLLLDARDRPLRPRLSAEDPGADPSGQHGQQGQRGPQGQQALPAARAAGAGPGDAPGPSESSPAPGEPAFGRLSADDAAEAAMPSGQIALEPLPSEDDRPVRARVVVVWGPHGSPGRSTVAVNLAAECAVRGVETTLVDLDTWGPSVAAMLGLLDEAAGVAVACRAADRDRLTPEALDRAAVAVEIGSARLTVLTGLTRPERWPELREGSVLRLLRACQHLTRDRPRASEESAAPRPGAGRPRWARGSAGAADPTPAPVVIVDVGFSLEEDEELSLDVEAPRRSAATLAALAEADLVVAVCAADVLGLPRAAHALPELMERTPAPVLAVANKVRRASAGHAPRAALRESWAAMGAPGRLEAFLPWDPRTLDAALLDGAVLAEAAPSAALRSELRTLAEAVLGRLDGILPEAEADASEEVLSGSRLGLRAIGARWRR